MEFAALALRFALASVFLVAGASKLLRLEEFADAVRNYGLLPSRIVRPIALTLAPLELAAGLLLAIGFAVRPVSLFLAGLLIAFTAAVAVNLLRGRAIDCGCFSAVVPRQMTWMTVARNLVLLVVAVVVAVAAPPVLGIDALLVTERSARLSTEDSVAAMVVGTVAITAVAIFVEFAHLRRSVRRSARVA